MPRRKPSPSGLSTEAKKELAAYQRSYQAKLKIKLQADATVKDNLLLRQLNEKVTALFHKVHNIQVDQQKLQATIAEANRVWIAILQRPEDRLDAAAELARERGERIEKYKK